MSISMDLRVLAKKLEQNSDELLSKASDKGLKVFDKVVTAIAASSSLLESVADDMDNNAEFSISEQQLDDLAAIATAFDQSNIPALKKQASVLDELLLSIAAPKNLVAKIKQANEDEVNRLRENYRTKRREEAYEQPKEAQSTFNQKKEIAKAVEQQVKKFVPLEAPLQTRYPPDRPGGHMTRITDHVYQDILTGIVYDFKQGYTTQKGNNTRQFSRKSKFVIK
jgi:adenylate kinase family enzyme